MICCILSACLIILLRTNPRVLIEPRSSIFVWTLLNKAQNLWSIVRMNKRVSLVYTQIMNQVLICRHTFFSRLSYWYNHRHKIIAPFKCLWLLMHILIPARRLICDGKAAYSSVARIEFWQQRAPFSQERKKRRSWWRRSFWSQRASRTGRQDMKLEYLTEHPAATVQLTCASSAT